MFLMKGYVLDWNWSMIANELLFSKSHVKYHGLVIVKTSKRTDIIVLFFINHCAVRKPLSRYFPNWTICPGIFNLFIFHLIWHSNVNSKRRHWSNNDKKENKARKLYEFHYWLYCTEVTLMLLPLLRKLP